LTGTYMLKNYPKKWGRTISCFARPVLYHVCGGRFKPPFSLAVTLCD
jgi:hypothetical protein